MNERIKQLRKEAWAFVTHDLETVERDHVITYSEHLEMHYAKFAELIVRECMKVADEGMAQVTMKVEWPSYHIKKHFGVEE